MSRGGSARSGSRFGSGRLRRFRCCAWSGPKIVRNLILSDIHANWEALEAVLNRAAGRYDRVVCCGDLIGYGPDPNRVLDWCRANVAFVIRGNHDKAACGLENLEWFNHVAKTAALWTLKHLTPVNME